jgi:hypothetical protein
MHFSLMFKHFEHRPLVESSEHQRSLHFYSPCYRFGIYAGARKCDYRVNRNEDQRTRIVQCD